MDRQTIVDSMLDFDLPPTGEHLFGEDFDFSAPAPPPEPEIIEPTFSASELEAARDAALQSGRAAALAEAAASDSAAIRQSLACIATQLDAAREAASQVAAQCAEATARLLLESLGAAMPALCARHGDAELAAVIATLLPALAQEPVITVRVHPRHAAGLQTDIERIDPDVAARCQIVEAEKLAPGDVRVTWRNGSATRDVRALWEHVAEALGATGLLSAEVAAQQEATIAG